jgi:hypothetical protein
VRVGNDMRNVRRLVVLGVVGVISAGLSPRSAAGDASPREDRARAVAAALENENLRMRAKIESAAILEKAGRREEAVAALREVETIRAEGKALVAALTAGPTVFVTPAGPRGERPPASPPAPAPAPRAPSPTARAVEAGARALTAARGPDGLWRSDPAGAGPADLAASGLAILALLEATDAENEVAASVASAGWADAALESLKALVARADPASGRFGDGADPETHAIATWATAAGLARFGDAVWRAPLRAAIARSLADRNAKGLWPSASGRPDDDWALAGFQVAMLEEAAHHASLVDGMDVPAAIARAQEMALSDQLARTELASLAGIYARTCLARQARRELGVQDVRAVVLEAPRIEGRLDATALLFATALRLGGAAADLEDWRRRVLDPVVAERREGRWVAGDPRSLRRGPSYASACVVLSLLAPTAEVRFPRSP